MNRKPLIIKNQNGDIIDLLEMNQKTFNKSIENKTIWYVDSETSRELPFDENLNYTNLIEETKFYVATINKLSTICSKLENLKNSENSDKNGKISQKKALNTENLSNSEWNTQIIQSLSQVIHKRHEEMPEGSYTTYLFNKGVGKIKKKTGEEAIELLLAITDDEIIYEAADFIYHMMVYLEVKNLNFGQILDELASRDK